MRISSVVFCALATVMLFASTAGAACPLSASGTKYSIKVETSPPGATIYFNNDKSCSAGTSPWSGKVTAGEITINAELAGYELGTRTVKVIRSRKAQEYFLPLTKKAEPPRIEVKADADPKGVAGAQVWLD